MAGGWIQAALLATANGKGGLPAWRWIFIIVSVITIPVAIFGKYTQHRHSQQGGGFTDHGQTGWFVIPNLPVHKSAWYLTKEERELAITRLGRAKTQTWDSTVFRRVLLSWQFYMLPFIFMRKCI